jgi:hypothetical protein
MTPGCPGTGDEAVGRLDLSERVAYPIDRRLMGLFGGEPADCLRRAGVLEQDNLDAGHTETIDGSLHADRRCESCHAALSGAKSPMISYACGPQENGCGPIVHEGKWAMSRS